jgi:glycosyltransferase involved in cell wall biosynthesis
VIPVFNEAENLPELCDRIEALFKAFDAGSSFEILFVDDGSTDNTPQILDRLEVEHPHIRIVQFLRNSGKSLALMAGFMNVSADVVITMDGDLQDNPEEIPLLVAKLDEGFDLVTGWRQGRQDRNVRKIGSKLFNYTVRKTTGLQLHDLNCGFKAYRRELVASICLFGDYHRYIPVQAHLDGFQVAEIPVSNSARRHGVSKYRTFRYQGFFDLLSLLFVQKYSLRPLHFFGVAATAFIGPSLLVLSWFTYQQTLHWMGYGEQVLNRPLFAASLTGLMLGVVILFTGFVCDFILHHKIRDRISGIVNARIRKRPPASD